MAGRAARRTSQRVRSAAALAPRHPTATRDEARVLASGLFDARWYLAQAAFLGDDVDELAALRHYLAKGRRAGRTPHRWFLPEWIDPRGWATAEEDPLVTYVRRSSVRRTSAPHPCFDPAAHVARHPGAARHPMGPLGDLLDRGPETPVDVAGPAGTVVTTRGAVEALLDEHLARWAGQEALRTAPRKTERFTEPSGARTLTAEEAARLAATSVSVVVPVWEREDLVEVALTSALAQEGLDLEVVVVDDGSRDGSVAAARAVAARDPRVVVVERPHEGVSAARNAGLAVARGEYVAFLDSDNTWRPGFLARMVAELRRSGRDVGYGVVAMDTGERTVYRALDAGRSHLEVINHVDLNVLVARADAVRAVGGFDTDLKRAVDYDLVWKLATAGPLEFVPVVGVDYHADDSDVRRITVTHGDSWGEVVKKRRLLDWDAVAAAPRTPGLTSLVVVTRDSPRALMTALSGLCAGEGAPGEVVVVDDGSRLSASLATACAELAVPALRVLRRPVQEFFALGADTGFAATHGDVVVLADDDVTVLPGDVGRLAAVLRERGAAAVQPVLVTRHGLVQHAGAVLETSTALPVPFLAGHHPDDVGEEPFEVPAPAASLLALDAARHAAVGGFDTRFRNGLHDTDLGLRLRAAGGTVLVEPRVHAVHVGRSLAREDPQAHHNFRHFVARYGGSRPDPAPTYADRGLEVVGWQPPPVGEQGAPRRPATPLVRRLRPVRTHVEGHEVPRLHWAIKIAAPFRGAQRWGDEHFAESLAQGLRRLGQHVVVDTRDTRVRPSAHLDDVVLQLRGLMPLPPQPGAVNLAWVISHPEDVRREEVVGYDGVFAASETWAEQATRAWGLPVHPLLQCTDPARFHPDAAVADTGYKVLFVGNSRNIRRRVVGWAVDADVRTDVVGQGWDGVVPSSWVRGEYLPNEGLAAAYRGAGVVLNDHWDDMLRDGFVSNRLFDAVASGARVLTDPVPGLEELFQGCAVAVRDAEHLRTLVDLPRDQVFPQSDERAVIADQVRVHHSFEARARTLLTHVLGLRGEEPLEEPPTG